MGWLGVGCIGGMHMRAKTPLVDRLIVEIDIRLRQEVDEAMLDVELFSRSARVVCTTRTPKVKRHTLLM